MKKVILAMLATLFVVILYSCAKEKDCVCSVEGSGDVRKFHLNDGDCIDVRYVNDGNGENEIRVLCMEDTLR